MSLSLIKAAMNADVPVLLWGAPGTGKTATIVAMAEDAGAHLEVLVGSTLDPVDVGGWLVPDTTGRVRHSPPPWAERIGAAIAAGRQAWLLLDELSTAPPSVQAALLRVVNERRVGQYSINGCRILAAANRAEHAADGGVLAAATANRWAHLEWSVDYRAWASGLVRCWGQPQPDGWAKAAASIAAYIHASPSALIDAKNTTEAWASPRTWTMAARLLCHAKGPDRVAAVAACVGGPAAAEWATHAAAGDLPDPEAVLTGREKWPTRGDRVLVTALGVVASALLPHEAREARIDMAALALAKLRPDVQIPPAATLVDGLDGLVPDALMPLADKIGAARRGLAAS